MDRQKIIDEIKGLEKNKFSLGEVEAEIQKRNKSPYGNIVDDMEVPEGNARTEAIQDYLASPGFRRLGLEILGGVAGAASGGTLYAASRVLRMAYPLLIRSLGAGIGEGAAAGLAQTFDPKESLAKEVLRGFATGMSAEAIGAAIPAIIKKIGFKGIKYTDEADKAEKLLNTVKAKNIKKGTSKIDDIEDGLITPGIGSDNRAIDILENITEKSIFAGGRIVKARKGAETALTNEVNTFVDSFADATTKTDSGELALSAIQNSLDYFRGIAKTKYAKVDSLAKENILSRTTGKVVGTRPITVNLRSSIDEAKKLLDDTKIYATLEPEAQKVLRTLAKLDNQPNVSFDAANGLRSRFLGITRSSGELIKGQAQSYAAKSVTQITKNIDETLDAIDVSASPGLRAAYDSAQRFYRIGSQKFNNKVLRRLTEKFPEEVYTTLIKPKRPSTIKALVRAIKSSKDIEVKKDLMSSIKGTIIGDIVGESDRLKRKLDASYVLREFNKYGDEVLEQIFTKSEIKNMTELLKGLEVAQRKSVGEGIPGALFIQLGQAGAAFGLFSGALTAPSAAILFGPAVVGQLFTSPKFIKFIKKGFQLNPGSREAYTNASQLIGAMISNSLISQDEGEDYLEDLRNSIKEDLGKKTKNNQPIISQENFEDTSDIDNIVGSIDNSELIETASLPTTAPLETQGINPANFNPKIMNQDASGLTSTETALLSPEEKAMTLRNRGMA